MAKHYDREVPGLGDPCQTIPQFRRAEGGAFAFYSAYAEDDALLVADVPMPNEALHLSGTPGRAGARVSPAHAPAHARHTPCEADDLSSVTPPHHGAAHLHTRFAHDPARLRRRRVRRRRRRADAVVMPSPGRVFWPLATALVLADCTTKRAAEAAAPLVGVPRPVVADVVRFTLAYNQGAAFSTHFGPYQRWVLITLTLVILGGLARLYGRVARTGWAATVGLALAAGGAVGNLLDRLASDRGVVDFIDIGVGTARFYVFNVADAGVTVGAALLAYALWRGDPRWGDAAPVAGAGAGPPPAGA